MCVEGFVNHLFSGGDACIREGCGARRVEQSHHSPEAAGVASETLADIRDELTDEAEAEAAPLRTTASKTPVRSRKGKHARRRVNGKFAKSESASSPEEPDRDVEASFDVQGVDAAETVAEVQGFIAEYLYGYSGNAFRLTATQLERLGRLYGKVMFHFNIRFEQHKWGAVVMLGVTQFSISSRAWRQTREEVQEKARELVDRG